MSAHDNAKVTIASEQVKRKRPPPPPPSFTNAYNFPKLCTDSSSVCSFYESNQSSKRIRTFEHIDGNYATFISLHIVIDQTKQEEIKKIILNQKGDWYPITDLHLSLTRTFTLRKHQITPFLELLRAYLPSQKSFMLKFSGLKYYKNDEQTASFLSMPLVRGIDQVKRLVRAIDDVVQQFGHAVYYENPDLHMSIATSSSSSSSSSTAAASSTVELDHSSESATVQQLVDSLHCKIGCKVYTESFTHS